MAERTIWSPWRVGDAQLAWINADFHGKRTSHRWRRIGITWRGSVRRVEQRRAVAHAARQRVLHRPAADDVAIFRTQRVASARRLETEQTTRRRWKANRPTQVIAVRGRNHARRDGGRGATTGPGRRSSGVP